MFICTPTESCAAAEGASFLGEFRGVPLKPCPISLQHIPIVGSVLSSPLSMYDGVGEQHTFKRFL